LSLQVWFDLRVREDDEPVRFLVGGEAESL